RPSSRAPPAPDAARAARPRATNGGRTAATATAAISTAIRTSITWGNLARAAVGRHRPAPDHGQDAEHLGAAPGLGEAATRGVRRVTAHHLRDVAEAVLADVGDHGFEQRPHPLAGAGTEAVDPQVSRGEGTEQPRPRRAGVVGRVPLALRPA